MLVLEFDLPGETISVLKTKKVNELIDENIRKLNGRKLRVVLEPSLELLKSL